MKKNPIRWGAWLLLGVLQMFALMITFGAWAVSRLWHHREYILPRVTYYAVVLVAFIIGVVVLADTAFVPSDHRGLDLVFCLAMETSLVGLLIWMDTRRANILDGVEWIFFARHHDRRNTRQVDLVEAD